MAFFGRTRSQIARLRRARPIVIVETSLTKYPLIREVVTELGWKWRDEESRRDFTIFWMDASPAYQRIVQLEWYQKMNHFPGTCGICHKHQLVHHIHRLCRRYPNERFFQQIVPPSFVLPFHDQSFRNFLDRNPVSFGLSSSSSKNWGPYWIVKPYSESQGRGIKIVKLTSSADLENVSLEVTFTTSETLVTSKVVVSQYVDDPLLLDSGSFRRRKFDLRLYVLMTQLRPSLGLFVYREGLVRLCSEQYQSINASNRENTFMHLSNYSINKKNLPEDDAEGTDDGQIKKTFVELNEALVQDRGLSELDIKNLWDSIYDVVVVAFLALYSELFSTYVKCLSTKGGMEKSENDHMCFEILGFDVMLDENLKPWLLEANVAPSFNTDWEIDRNVKHGVVKEALQLIAVDPADRTRHLIREKQMFLKRMMGESIELEELRVRSPEEDREWHQQAEERHILNYVKVYPTPERLARFGQFFDLEKGEGIE